MIKNEENQSAIDALCFMQHGKQPDKTNIFFVFVRVEFQSKKEKISLDCFTLLTVIGKGAYAKVVLVQKIDDGRLFALKVLKKALIQQKKQIHHAQIERAVLGEMEHPFIIKMIYAFQTEKNLYFCLEYCPGGELFHLLQKQRVFKEDQQQDKLYIILSRAKFYVAQILEALDYLHKKNILYRDLKPENVLIDKWGYIKLTDFGLAKKGVHGNEGAISVCGTPEYLAPEIINCQSHGKPVDWWTFGSILYEMVVGMPAYYSNNRQDLFDKIRNSPVFYPSHLPPKLKDLLQKLLIKNPLKRLGANGGDEVRQHPWFQHFDWHGLLCKQIKPPFVPILKDEFDVNNFDRVQLQMNFKIFYRSLFKNHSIRKKVVSILNHILVNTLVLIYIQVDGFTYQDSQNNLSQEQNMNHLSSYKTLSPEIIGSFEMKDSTKKHMTKVLSTEIIFSLSSANNLQEF